MTSLPFLRHTTLMMFLSLPAGGFGQADPLIRDQPVSEWLRRLGDPEAQVRKDAAKVLRDIPVPVKAAVPTLTRALKDDESAVRRDCAFALGRIGPEAATAAADLGLLLDDNDFGVRFTAALSLGKIGPGATAAVPALEKALKDIHPRVVVKAAEALMRIDPSRTRPAVAVLTDILREKSADPTPRFEAAIALGRSAPADAKNAIDALAEAMATADEFIRVRAAGALLKTGAPPKDKARKLLRRVMEDVNETEPLRVEAAAAWAAAEPAAAPQALVVLHELARGSLPGVRAAAAEALRQLEPAPTPAEAARKPTENAKEITKKVAEKPKP